MSLATFYYYQFNSNLISTRGPNKRTLQILNYIEIKDPANASLHFTNNTHVLLFMMDYVYINVLWLK